MRYLTFTAVFFQLAFAVAAPPPSSVEDELARARENVRIAEATVAKIEADLTARQADPNADPEVVAARTVYLDKVKGLLEGHRRILREMEDMARQAGIPVDPPASLATNQVGEASIVLQDPNALDEVQILELELYRALGEYDEILRKSRMELSEKLRELRAKANESMSQMAREAAEAAKSGGGGGQGGEGGKTAGGGGAGGSAQGGGAGETAGNAGGQSGGTPGGETAGGGIQTGGGTQGGGAQTGGAQGGTETAGGGGGAENTGRPAGGGASGGGSEPRPPTRPGAEDDDIVARQLREAAEQEKDPVLREKLWREYEAYKRSTRR